MHIERIHKMQECLTEKALNELEKGTESVCTEEFGEVVDMIKDLAEAEYRSVIVKSMKEADEEEKEYDRELLKNLKMEYGEEGGRRFYDEYRYKTTGRYAPKGRGTYVGRRGYEEPPYWHMYPEAERMRDMDRDYGKMYYTDPTAGSNMRMTESSYDRAKRNYTETKEMHKGNTQEDKEHKMKSLDSYAKELTSDITGMIADMTAEEKNLLRNKLSNLVSKI